MGLQILSWQLWLGSDSTFLTGSKGGGGGCCCWALGHGLAARVPLSQVGQLRPTEQDRATLIRDLLSDSKSWGRHHLPRHPAGLGGKREGKTGPICSCPV